MTESDSGRGSDLDAVASLGEPLRRALYSFVAASAQPVSRDDAAHAVEVSREVAAYHLNRLADDGLLEVEYRRLSGRTGPGAGRPTKLYRRSDRVHEVSIPPRRYELAARILLDASREGHLEPGALTDAARRTIADHETLVLSERDRAAFFEALINPPEPSEQLVHAIAEHKRRIAS